MRITAAVTEANGAPFQLAEVDLGDLRADEILVQVAASGICHTDLICRDQWIPVPLPAVLGHEGAGTVSRVGSGVTAFRPGDKVMMSFDSCGSCPCCLQAKMAYCHDFFGRNFAATRADGSSVLSRDGQMVHAHYFGQSSFSTHAVARERNVVLMPHGIPFDVAAPFGCGIQTGAGAIFNSLRPPAGSSVAVFGVGTVGMAAVMAAAIAGCSTVIAVDVHDSRLELAREVGATASINARDSDLVADIRALTGGGVNYSIETTGSPAVLRQAIDATAPLGVCGSIGAAPFGSEVAVDMTTILTGGRSLRGIVEGDSVPALFLPVLVELWKTGRFPVDRLMRSYDFDQIEAAVAASESGATIKPILRMS